MPKLSNTVVDVVVQTKSTEGMKLSYRLHKLLQSSSDHGPIRGIRLLESCEMSVASSLYTLVRGNRANRRYLLTMLLKMFEDDSVRCITWQNYVECGELHLIKNAKLKICKLLTVLL